MSRPDVRFAAPLVVATILNPVNSSIIATALVSIGRDVGVGVGSTAVLVGAVYIASAVAQPVMGRLADILGARRVLLAGLAVVAVGGIVGGLASTIQGLTLSRVLIGLGTSAGYPTAMALIRQRDARPGTPPAGRLLSVIAVSGQATAALGLPLGGLIVQTLGWRWVFLVNVPLAVVGVVLALVGLPRDGSRPAGESRLREPLDVLGAALFAVFTVGLLSSVQVIPDVLWWGIVAALLAASLLVWRERQVEHPFLDVRALARSGAEVRTYVRTGLAMFVVYSVIYGVSQWLEIGRGLDPGAVGVVLLPVNVVGIVLSLLLGRRGLVRWPLVAVGVSVVVGGLLLMVVDETTPVLVLSLVLSVFAVTMGAGVVANQAALFLQAPAARLGQASGLLRTSTYTGAIASTSVAAMALGSEAPVSGLTHVALLIVGVGVALTAITLVDRALPHRTDS